MKVTDIVADGIIMIGEQDKTLIPRLFFLRDKSLNNNFNKNQLIEISIENITKEDMGEDIVNKSIILYAVVNVVCSGGIWTKYYDEDKGAFHKTFFYDGKGLITLPTLRKGNPFEIGDFVKMEIKNV